MVRWIICWFSFKAELKPCYSWLLYSSLTNENTSVGMDAKPQFYRLQRELLLKNVTHPEKRLLNAPA